MDNWTVQPNLRDYCVCVYEQHIHAQTSLCPLYPPVACESRDLGRLGSCLQMTPWVEKGGAWEWSQRANLQVDFTTSKEVETSGTKGGDGR